MAEVKERVSVDLTVNPKQADYFYEVVKACNGIRPWRKFAYGGAIRGGKTFVTLFILLYLCDRFPGSRWVIIRSDFPNLQATTIESLKKMLYGSKRWRWNHDKSNFYCQNDKGSRIMFKAENITKDPDLNDFLGLEINGVFFEQLEEINQKTWQVVMSRCGSWYIPDMPPAFMFTTFNPTQKWPKQFIYERWILDTLPDDFYYQSALPSDNAFVTADQWNTWGQMDERYQSQFIGGDWTNFDDTDPRWSYAFDSRTHVKDTLPFYPGFPVYLAFDFNREPMTCTAIQRSDTIGTPHSFVHFLKEYRGNWQLHEISARVLSDFPAATLFVCGDVSGKKGDVGYTERHMTHYKLLAQYLKINFKKQVHLNDKNLEHADSRLLVNTMLNCHPNVRFSREGCPQLIKEYEKSKVDLKHKNAGHLLKDRGDNQLDLFDGSRYFWQTYYLQYLNKLLAMTGQGPVIGRVIELADAA